MHAQSATVCSQPSFSSPSLRTEHLKGLILKNSSDQEKLKRLLSRPFMRGYARLYQARRPQFTPGTSRGLICVQLKSQPFPSFALFGTTGSRRLAPFSLALTTPATQPQVKRLAMIGTFCVSCLKHATSPLRPFSSLWPLPSCLSAHIIGKNLELYLSFLFVLVLDHHNLA